MEACKLLSAAHHTNQPIWNREKNVLNNWNAPFFSHWDLKYNITSCQHYSYNHIAKCWRKERQEKTPSIRSALDSSPLLTEDFKQKRASLTQSYEMEQINPPQIHLCAKREVRLRVGSATTAAQLHYQRRVSCSACGDPYWHRGDNLWTTKTENPQSVYSACCCLGIVLRIPAVSPRTSSQPRFCAKPEPCVKWCESKLLLRAVLSSYARVCVCVWGGGSVARRCGRTSPPVLRAAGEMLSAAGKKKREGGGGRERERKQFVQEDINQPALMVRDSVALIKCDTRFILQQKPYDAFPTGTYSDLNLLCFIF